MGYIQESKLIICKSNRFHRLYSVYNKREFSSSRRKIDCDKFLTKDLSIRNSGIRSFTNNIDQGVSSHLKHLSCSRDDLSLFQLFKCEDDNCGLKESTWSRFQRSVTSNPVERISWSKFIKYNVNYTIDLWGRNEIRGNGQQRRSMSTSGQTINLTKQSHDDVTEGEENKTEVKSFQNIPGPIGLPYVGVLPLFKTDGRFGVGYKANDLHNFLISCYRRYGNLFKVKLNGQTTVHIFDPDLIQKVYQNVGKMPHIVPLLVTTQLYRKFRNMSPGLGNTNGDEWYRMRSAVQQVMMVPRAVPAFLPQVNLVADEFISQRIERHRDSQTGLLSNISNEISKWNLESSAMTCFEMRLGCLSEEAKSATSWQQRMIDANNEIFRLSAKIYFSLPWHLILPTPTWKRLIDAEDFFFGSGQKLVDEACSKIRAQLKQPTEELKSEGWTFLRYLLNKCESSDGQFTYKDLSIIALSLFADGLSTTSPTVVGQLYCLASNNEKQNKLYEEIMRIAPDRNQSVTDDILQRATYLKACIKEGFRFFPIGVDVSRVLNNDIVLAGYRIPAGTPLSLNNNLLLREEHYFTEAESYQPERWLRGSGDRHPYLLLPFGHGTRMCAGMRIAEQEMRVLIIKLLQRYRLELAPNHPPLKQKYCMLLRPDRDPAICFIPRS